MVGGKSKHEKLNFTHAMEAAYTMLEKSCVSGSLREMKECLASNKVDINNKVWAFGCTSMSAVMFIIYVINCIHKWAFFFFSNFCCRNVYITHIQCIYIVYDNCANTQRRLSDKQLIHIQI